MTMQASVGLWAPGELSDRWGLPEISCATAATGRWVPQFTWSVSWTTLQSPSGSWVCSVWNTVGGAFAVVGSLAAGLVGMASTAWSAFTAAAIYVGHVAEGLATWAEQAVAPELSVLKAVGQALEAALLALLAFVKKEVTAFLARVMGPIASAVQDMTSFYANPVFSGLDPSPGLGAAVFGSAMNELLIIGATITTSLFVATGIITGLSFGVGDVVLFVAPLLITLAFQALGC